MERATLRFAPAGLTILLCALLTGFLGSSCKGKPPLPMEKITIAVPTLPHATLIYVAHAKNYFGEEGLNVTLRPYPYGKVALDAMISGESDFATSGETPIMFAAMKGEGIVVVADTMASGKDQGVVARRGSGIGSPADLKGKKIGFPAGTNAEYFLDVFLTIHSVPKSTVKAVPMKLEDMGDALATGRIDAVSIWNPYLIGFGKELGDKVVTFYGELIYVESFPVTAKKAFVATHPEAVKKLIRALLKAEAFVREHPSDSIDIVAGSIKTGKETVKEVWPCYEFRVKLDQSLMVNLENQARWAIRRKLSDRKEIPNFQDFFYLDGLSAVKPDAITMIR